MPSDAATLPWLERHVRALTAKQVVDLFKSKYIPTDEEIVRYVGERYRRLKPPKHRDRVRRRVLFEYKRLELVYNIVTAKLSDILELPTTESMDEFHRTLVRLFVGDDYDNALRAVRRALRLAREFWESYRLTILSSTDPEEAKRFRREGSGRILSLVRRLRRHLNLLRRVREEIVKTHVVSEGLPVVVVAGIPSAGKSTLVRRLSTAEPEVADYPFTTKTVIVGKVRYRQLTFYMVDTPGILERPLDQLNEIERKALAALMTLPDVVLFLFDVSPTAYVGVDGQLALYRSVSRMASERGVDVVVAANKVDAADEKVLARVREEVGEVIEISALTGRNVDALLDRLYELLRRRV